MPGRSRFRSLIHSKLSFTLPRFRLFGIIGERLAPAMPLASGNNPAMNTFG